MSSKQLKERILQLEQENADLKLQNDYIREEYNRLKKQNKPPKFYISSDRYLEMIDYVMGVLITEGKSLNQTESIKLLSNMRKIAE